MAIDLIVVVVMLALQPLFGILYAYLAMKGIIKFGSRKSGEWADNRIEKAKDAAEDLK